MGGEVARACIPGLELTGRNLYIPFITFPARRGAKPELVIKREEERRAS